MVEPGKVCHQYKNCLGFRIRLTDCMPHISHFAILPHLKFWSSPPNSCYCFLLACSQLSTSLCNPIALPSFLRFLLVSIDWLCMTPPPLQLSNIQSDITVIILDFNWKESKSWILTRRNQSGLRPSSFTTKGSPLNQFFLWQSTFKKGIGGFAPPP